MVVVDVWTGSSVGIEEEELRGLMPLTAELWATERFREEEFYFSFGVITTNVSTKL